ncbi:MAG: SpoIIE family protein phosphatase [Clostridia bacterium]|nr:SpoIIE family protein phosphatase [Clostridia bacterium]
MNVVISILSNSFVTVPLYFLLKHPKIKEIPYMWKQLAIGLIFGLLAIYNSDHGVAYLDGYINVRDASVVLSGLAFGAPAGLISGFLSGLYRLILGTGTYTRLASSIATMLIGVICAIQRKYVLEGRRPSWIYGAGITCVCEDIHMLLICSFNMRETAEAYSYIRNSSIRIVFGNALSVAIALLIIAMLRKDKEYYREKGERITRIFTRYLVICITIAYCLTSLFTYRLQSDISEAEVEGNIFRSIQEIKVDILMSSKEEMLSIAKDIEEEYEKLGSSSISTLKYLADSHGVYDINIIGSDGIVKRSNKPEIIGFDMNSGTQSREFMRLFDEGWNNNEFVQEYGPVSENGSISRKYCGILMRNGNLLQIGYSHDQFRENLDEQIYSVIRNRHIGNRGFIFVCDEDKKILASENQEYYLNDIGIRFDEKNMLPGNFYHSEYDGEIYIFSYIISEGYYIFGGIPEAEANYMRDFSTYFSILLQILVFTILFFLLYFLVKRVIIKNLETINGNLSEISNGNLDVKVDVHASREFSTLSEDINKTVDTLKKYIREAESRIDAELEYAKQIQFSALPSVFPPYPDEERFDVFACMFTAKEVGGDFYDFYKIDEDRIAFLIADVSGKGIPASLFMMRAKTTIKDLAEQKLPVNEILIEANNRLCEGNEAGMFVTVFMAIADLKTGKLTYANAGHNPPLLLRKGGDFEFLRARPGLVLAGMEGMPYRLNEIEILPGDRIFLYTDGVTEATDESNNLFGEELLHSFINEHKDELAKNLLPMLKKAIDGFAGNAPQFDDITMLIFDYFGGIPMQEEKTFPADINALPDVQSFFESSLEKIGCSMKTMMAVSVAIEEIFVNVAHYAYPEGEGDVTVGFSYDSDSRTAGFRIRDKGIRFNPLEHKDPDITLSADERSIGGLGIFITRKTMDSVSYRYYKGENILTMKKRI